MTGPMDDEAYKPVRLAAKPNAAPSMTVDERDALEHRLHCQCGTCTLDVYTCRTTDFTCPVSPAMHRDVMSLVAGGYGADEILATFQQHYGEKVLMAPRKQGFNWLGYIVPFAALVGGAVFVAILLKRWQRPAASGSTAAPAIAAGGPVVVDDAARRPIAASDDELRRIEAAIRNDRT